MKCRLYSGNLLPHPVRDACQGGLQPGWIISPRLCQICPSAPLAAHLLSNKIDQFPGLKPVSPVFSDAGHQAYFIILNGCKHKGCRAQFVFQLIHCFAQGLWVCAVKRPGNDLDPVDVHCFSHILSPALLASLDLSCPTSFSSLRMRSIV